VEDLPDAQPKPSRAVQRRMQQRQQKVQGLVKEQEGDDEEE
jgi:exonuclease VII small subunit